MKRKKEKKFFWTIRTLLADIMAAAKVCWDTVSWGK